ncbi:hypothetical protein T05_3141 [Trichinella murrelli]|uniref:Uncharacterized protein n=1 Tax=Trichinella murrelli TaxID=144512 RepID=A0A0V0TFM6_9BILA|nr:hypothetical protein T05_3141 [Trichinella murrelli]
MQLNFGYFNKVHLKLENFRQPKIKICLFNSYNFCKRKSSCSWLFLNGKQRKEMANFVELHYFYDKNKYCIRSNHTGNT